MTKPDDPVYPCGHGTTNDGIALREWYAGLALQGLLANGSHKMAGESPTGEFIPTQRFAEEAVQAADYLIAALNGQRWTYDLDGGLIPAPAADDPPDRPRG